MSKDWKQKSLTPVLLKKNDPSYKTVDDLLHAIEDENILNIAVTGPYGSGKSSVLFTLMEEAPKDAIFLDISLATLDADNSIIEGKNSEIHNNDKLNRKIEYSILQQLVYRETLNTLPFSRLKKIRHLSLDTIKFISFYIIVFFSSVSFAFFPSWSLIEQLYSSFNVPVGMQRAIQMIAVIFILVMLYEIITHFIQTFGGMRIGHVNVGGNEIDISDEGSIFNRYLDEILYFFQCTNYNVVIIEDLDRFNTTDIFLKLRELNHLINKSKIVNRKIRFIYAVKDDMFKDASRSKFFDYITTVIPVITTSNSKDKLKEALSELGHDGEIPYENIRDIAFHIDDMRLLYNIANEYHQYSVRLNSDKNHPLDDAKMLAMITVKNYHPHDFSLLHKREGKIYKAISNEAKRLYVNTAIKQEISNREQLYKKKLDIFNNTSHLSESELRLVYLMRIVAHTTHNIVNITINGKNKSILQVVNSEDDFNTIINEGQLSYNYINHYNVHVPVSISFDFSKIEKEVNPKYSLDERMNNLSEGREQLLDNIQSLEMEKARIHTFTIKDLLMKFNLYEDKYFQSLELSPMEEDFIRNGLIAEDYNDYISYFYPGIMSLSDHQLCLDMRLDRNPSYDCQIDDCNIFLSELPDSAFQYKSVLNIQLLDFLAQNHDVYQRKYDLTINLLLSKFPPEFLISYIKEKNNDRVWNSMMETNSDILWIKSGSGSADQNIMFYRQWILHCKEKHVKKSQITWINNHYDEIAICYSQLSKDLQAYFTTNFMYNELTDTSHDMLSAVVKAQCYTINEHNMPYVVKKLEAAGDISKLTEIEEKEISIKQNLINPTWRNINTYFSCKEKIIDDILFDFISSHLSDMSKCEDEEYYTPLFQSLMEFTEWKDEDYAYLCAFNPFHITLTEKIISGLSSSKLVKLIESGAVEDIVDNFKLLSSNSIEASVEFIKRNISLFKDYIDSIDLDASLAHAFLTEPSLNQVNDYVIQSLDSTFLVMTPSLADDICMKLSHRYAKCDKEILFQAVALSNQKDNAVMAATHAIEVLKLDNIITELLKKLGDNYARLTEFHISKNFEDTPSNNFLIKTLQTNGYISSYSIKEGKIKVNTKKSR